MYKLIAVFCLVCGALAGAQTQTAEKHASQEAGPQAQARTSQGKEAGAAKKQQEERGLRMLEQAEAQAGALQGGMRAYACWQLARAYRKSNQAKVLELLEFAMAAARDMDDDDRGDMQEAILREMVPMAPQRAEELLTELEVSKRAPVLNALLGYYEKNKDLDHAIELVYRIGQEKEIPYETARRLMALLPPERNGDLLQLFTVSFTSFRDHSHATQMMGGDEFSVMVTQFWRRLPPNLVHDAIDELLKQAGERPDAKISIFSDNGPAAFNSLYEYRLFQLLSLLRQIDPSQADDLLKKNEQMKPIMAKYPEGTTSLAGDASKAKGGLGMGFSVSSGGAASVDPEDQQARRVLAEADEHPDTALAQVAVFQSAYRRATLYQTIAHGAVKKKPSVARNAVEKLLSTLDNVQYMFQLEYLRSAAELYLELGDNENAKKVVERGFKLADKLQTADTNADDPNKALKAYWPSAEAWRIFTRLAGQISPTWAMEAVEQIPDPEMKVLAQTALAQQWLGVSRGTSFIMSSNKEGRTMRMGSFEEVQ